MRLLLPIVTFIGVLASAAYADTAFIPPMTVLHEDITYDVNADGTYSRSFSFAGRFETAKSLDDGDISALPYSADLETIKVLDAYTITPDGRRINVASDKIADEENPLSTGAPEFSDEHVIAIAFPGVVIGAVKHYDYVETVRKPYFPGNFTSVDHFRRNIAYDEASITITAPTTMALQNETRMMTGSKALSQASGTQTWRWQCRNVTGIVPQGGSVNVEDVSPLVAVTSFKTAVDAGDAYQGGAAPAFAVTPKVQKLSDEITAGISGKQAKAVALYQWVSRNIRYVAFEIGRGGIVPHMADAIIDSGYGDCKDHVTLLQALLAAQSIQSEGVLVDSRDAYWSPAIPLSVGAFDHIITYIPMLKAYVDSTAEFAPFGVLPPQEAGKAALATGAPGINAGMVVLPLTSVHQDKERIDTNIRIGPDGSIAGVSTITDAGYNEYENRAFLAQIPNGQQGQIAERILALFGQQGVGSLIYSEPRNLGKPLSFQTQFSLPQAVNLPGPGSMSIPVGITTFGSIEMFPREVFGTRGSLPMTCLAGLNDERTTLQLAPGMTVKFLPAALHAENTIGSYDAAYSQQGSTVTVTRRLLIEPGTPTCDPHQFAMIQQIAAAVGRDLRSTVIY